MSRAAVDQLVYLLDEAFEGIEQPWHSVLGNLASVTEDAWLWTPPGGARTIRTLTAHIGGAAYLYHDRVFGDCAAFGNPVPTWSIPAGNVGHGTEDLQSAGRLENEPPMADVIAWVAERARTFRDAVAALIDANLVEMRPSHFGEPKPIRWFVAIMIQHYSYHAGEINHIRALHQGDDG